MEIRTEEDITPEAARQLRALSGMTQKSFWEEVGSNQSSGHWFESNKRRSIPKPIRMLIFLRHVANTPVNSTRKEDADIVMRCSAEIAARVEAQRAEAAATEALRVAREAQERVKNIAA